MPGEDEGRDWSDIYKPRSTKACWPSPEARREAWGKGGGGLL